MVAFTIFWRNIYWYWVFYLIWFITVYSVFFCLGKKRIFCNFKLIQNLLEKDLDSFFIYIILWVLVWGRLWHVFIYDFDNFVWNWLEIFKVWHGWMSFIWWFLWVLFWTCIYFFKNKFSFKDIFIVFDLAAWLVPLCIALWRFWNFLNQELYWIEFLNSFNWPVSVVEFFKSINFLYVYDKVDSLLRINTNFLSIVFEWLVLFLIISVIINKQVKKGVWKIWKSSMIFLLWYSFVRFLLEYVRFDSQNEIIVYFSKSQRVFLFFILFGLFGSILVYKQKKINL